MPIVYPNLAQVQEMNRDQLLFLYRNLPIAENPREIEVIREISLMLGPNPVPDLLRQARDQLESPPTFNFSGSFTKAPTISNYNSLTSPAVMTAELVETREKSILLSFELNPLHYSMLSFKPKLKVFFPKSKVNQTSKTTWEIERDILVSNIKTSYSKFRDYCKSKYNKNLPEEAFLTGGLTV